MALHLLTWEKVFLKWKGVQWLTSIESKLKYDLENIIVSKRIFQMSKTCMEGSY